MTYQAIFFDVDGTLTTSEPAWVQVHTEMGTLDKEKKYYAAFFRGEFDYYKWAELDAGLWKGQPVDKFERSFKNVEEGIRPGVKEGFAILKRHKILTFLVSSGICHYVKLVNSIIGADYFVSNIIKKENGYLTGGVTVKVPDNKVGAITKLAEEHQLNLQKCAAVGDAFNDRDMFKAVGKSLVVSPKDKMTAETATYVSQSPKDFRKALMLLFEEETAIYQELKKALQLQL